jgi:hypothetical protein
MLSTEPLLPLDCTWQANPWPCSRPAPGTWRPHHAPSAPLNNTCVFFLQAERERMAMQQIDWHDFVVVETITFDDDEDAALPPPMSMRDVINLNRVNDYVEEGAQEDVQEEQAAAGGRPDLPCSCCCWPACVVVL